MLVSHGNAQQAGSPAPVATTISVLGSPVPIEEQESARTVVTLDLQRAPLASSVFEDWLRTDASVDIEQRGAGGTMADVSIRGASFEQTLVLLNGLRMDDAETAHFNLDVPVPTETIGHIDVLHGTGSTLYGSDAIGGVVDVRTAVPDRTGVRLQGGAGSFGENQQSAVAGYAGSRWSDALSGDRQFSTGFMADRDYRTEDVANEIRGKSAIGSTDLLLAGDDRAFGANQFYGPYVSWERTKGWFAGLTQQWTQQTQTNFGYRRHSDIFLLERDQPTGYKNQHIDQSFEGAVRDGRGIATNLQLATGLEELTDQIHSTNLGDHGRNRGAGYATLQWLKPASGSVTLGAREEVFSGGRAVFSPMLSATRWLPARVKLFASASRGFRIPTFLDLYYSDPSTRGNPNLRPESAWNFEGGAGWFPTPRTEARVTTFYSRQHDTIDYTRASAKEQWQASNLRGLRFAGVEASLDWQPKPAQFVRVSWTNLTGAQSALNGLQSEYVFNYPVNNARVEWTGTVWSQVLLDTRLGVLQRFKRSPYAVWDVSAERGAGRVRPYLRMTNLTNTGYDEIVGVRMPGRAFEGGLQLVLTRAAQ